MGSAVVFLNKLKARYYFKRKVYSKTPIPFKNNYILTYTYVKVKSSAK